jgi:hypothetical protein
MVKAGLSIAFLLDEETLQARCHVSKDETWPEVNLTSLDVQAY